MDKQKVKLLHELFMCVFFNIRFAKKILAYLIWEFIDATQQIPRYMKRNYYVRCAENISIVLDLLFLISHSEQRPRPRSWS